MSKTIDVIQVSNDTFNDVFTTVSLLANAFLSTVTVAANSSGELTTGNGFVTGVLGANTIVATNIRGGNVATSANLIVTSNLTVNGATSRFNSNVEIVAASINIASNSTVSAISVQSNSSATWINFGGSWANVTANLILSGSGLRLPVGNSSTRPASANSGFIRFNDETSLLEMYVGSDWQSFVAYSNTFTATAVYFEPGGIISANNVQAAIEELDAEKLSLTGGTLTGNVVINRNGLTLPTSLDGTVLQIGQPNSNNVIVELDSFEAYTQILGRRTAGGNGSRSAIGNNEVILKLSAAGYDGSGYGTESATVQLVSDGTHNTSSKPTKVVVSVTANGSTSTSNVMVINSSGVSVTGNIVSDSYITAASLGANAATINNLVVNTSLIANGALLTTINASAISSGTIPAARLPAANSTTIGGVSIANTVEFTSGTSNNKVLTPGQVFNSALEVTLTYSGNTIVTTGDAGLDMSDFINGVITLTKHSTLGEPLNVKPGQSGCIRIVQDGTGSRSLAFHTAWEFIGGIAPSISSAANSEDLLFYHAIAPGRVFGSLVRGVS